MKILSILCLLSLFLSPGLSRGQDIVVSNPVRKNVYSTMYVLGKVGSNYIVVEEVPLPNARKILRVFDHKMQQVGKKKLLRLPGDVMNINLTAYDSYLLLTYVEKAGDKYYYHAQKMNGEATAIGQPVILDSLVTSMQRPGAWDLVTSADNKKLLISRTNYGMDSVLISTRTFNPGLELLSRNEGQLFLQYPYEMLGRMLISNAGDIYFPLFPMQNNSFVSRFEILSKTMHEHAYRSVLLDMKTKFLSKSSALIKIDECGTQSSLLINAAYYPDSSGNLVEGLFTARVNAVTNQLKAVLNRFNDNLLSAGKLTSSHGYRSIVELDEVFFLRNGGLMIVGKLDKGQRVSYSSPRSFLTMNVNPRFMYDPSGFRFGGLISQMSNANMYIDPYSSAPLNVTQLYNKDIVVCYLDSNLTLRQQKIIEKKQSDLKKVNPLYLDFGTVNTSSAVHFFYREVKKGGGLIRNTSFSPNGEMQRLPPLRTADELFKLIPSQAKQVGVRQVIIPGTYRGKMIFAKVDL